MRFFALVGFRDIILFFFPTLVLIILLYIALSRSHFRSRHSQLRETEITSEHPEGIQSRSAPFPLFLILIITGYLIWTVCYILAMSFFGVKI